MGSEMCIRDSSPTIHLFAMIAVRFPAVETAILEVAPLNVLSAKKVFRKFQTLNVEFQIVRLGKQPFQLQALLPVVNVKKASC